MIKITIESVNPETKLLEVNTFEAEAVFCAAVTNDTEDKNRVRIDQALVGNMNNNSVRAMMEALVNGGALVLDGLDPDMAQMLLLEKLIEKLSKMDEEGEDKDVVAGTGEKPEGPSEQ